MPDGPWDMIRAEREALAGDLAGLDDARWATPSLCEGWSVRDVLAHLTATAKISPLGFFAKLVGSGFRLTRMQERDIATERGATPADTLDRFRAVVSSKKHPPGPVDSWLGEVVVHGEDIRRPLGITRAYPADAVVRVLDSYKGSNLVIGAKRRIAGVRLVASDTDWSSGEGPEARGPAIALLMAAAGRKAALDDLTGEGVPVLRGR